MKMYLFVHLLIYVQMKSYEIQRRSLVVAIWDDDSGKSHDDYMEGVGQIMDCTSPTTMCSFR